MRKIYLRTKNKEKSNETAKIMNIDYWLQLFVYFQHFADFYEYKIEFHSHQFAKLQSFKKKEYVHEQQKNFNEVRAKACLAKIFFTFMILL